MHKDNNNFFRIRYSAWPPCMPCIFIRKCLYASLIIHIFDHDTPTIWSLSIMMVSYDDTNKIERKMKKNKRWSRSRSRHFIEIEATINTHFTSIYRLMAQFLHTRNILNVSVTMYSNNTQTKNLMTAHNIYMSLFTKIIIAP